MTEEIKQLLKSIKIQTFESIDRPQVFMQTSLYAIHNKIRMGNGGHKELIENYRELASNQEKDYYKKSKIPAAHFSFRFAKKRTDADIIENIPLLYIDIDVPDFPINELNHKKILMRFHSIGGKHYGIIVLADGLNYENWVDYYKYVCQQLSIPIDKHKGADTFTIKRNQSYCISYDENIWVNEKPYYFTAPIEQKGSDLDTKQKGSDLDTNRESISKSVPLTNINRFRFHNADDFDFKGEDYIVCADKFDFIEAKAFGTIYNGSRHYVISTYANNFLYLNPWLEYNSFSNWIKRLNKAVCVNPMPVDEIEKIVKYKYSKLKRNELTPVMTKRMIIFNPAKHFVKNQKKELIPALRGKAIKEKNLKIIYDAIEGFDWSTKLTQKMIAEKANLSLKTIKRYFSNNPELKTFVNNLNDEIF